MTNADKIRNLSDEELVDLLAWGEVYAEGLKVPSCDEGCEDCESAVLLSVQSKREKRTSENGYKHRRSNNGEKMHGRVHNH